MWGPYECGGGIEASFMQKKQEAAARTMHIYIYVCSCQPIIISLKFDDSLKSPVNTGIYVHCGTVIIIVKCTGVWTLFDQMGAYVAHIWLEYFPNSPDYFLIQDKY